MDNSSFEKNKGPYHGIWLVILILIGLPLGLKYFFFKVIKAYALTSSIVSIKIQAQVFSGLVCTTFCVILMIMGILTKEFKIVCNRVAEFLYAIRYESIEHAFRWYWQDTKEKGYCFWIYLILIIFNIYFLVDGLVLFITNYMS